MSEVNNIPKHWQLKKLGEVCETTSGGTPSRSNKKYYEGKIPWVKSGELDKGLIIDTEEKITQEAIDNSSAKIFPKGTLLIALYGATIGKLSFLGIDAATNQAVCGIFQNEKINSKYLYQFLFFKKPSLVKQSIGGAQPNISQGILKNLEIPLPPPKEQTAIVSKIEELLSDLENGKQQLLTAQQQLKTYRQSLLKWAFEGRLTNKNVNGELPKGWKWMKLSEITEVKDGTHDTPKYIEDGIPFVTQKNIREKGLTFSDIKFITEADHEKFFKRSNVSFDDILISMIGANRGMSCIVNDKRVFSIKNVGLVKSNPKTYETKYLAYFLKSIYSKNYVKSLSKGGAQEFVGLTELRNFPIVYCSLKEQEQIVSELESKLTVCDKIEETISTSLQQAEMLKQSILKKAFEGRLVN